MSDAEPSPDPKPAPRLGSYLLSKQLGSGGMSNVFRAVHEESGSVVAVKVLPRSLAKNITLLQRFLREAKSAEALDHPNIVAIYDRGFDQGRHYLVLEFVEGRDLHDRVRLNGPMGPDEAIRFVREVAEGLRYAASQGMIHRDVKPANLLMTPDGHAKIIDLGLALQVEDEDERVTRDGTTVGTVDYISPEQARDSRQTSERSDIYSLGCTFYYLLTGSQPFPGGGLADKLARHYRAPIPDIRAIRPELPEALSLLIRRMMEKKPEQRYSDYTRLIAALDALTDADASPHDSRPPIVLDALIVEDEDDSEDIDSFRLAPTESAVTPVRAMNPDRPPSTRDYLTAEIVDDEDDEDFESPRPSRSNLAVPRSQPQTIAEISLADLAALEGEGQVSNRRQGRRDAEPRPPRLDVPPLDDLLDDEPVEDESTGARRSNGPELSLNTWIAAAIMVGLAIAIVGFGVSTIISLLRPKPPEVAAAIESESSADPAPSHSTPRPPTATAGPVRPIPRTSSTVTPRPIPEPSTAAAAPAKENEYSRELEGRLAPRPFKTASPTADRPRVVVRRLLDGGDDPQVSSLAVAFGRASDVVEIADNGPFFEDDFQLAGKARRVRARPGFRPIIKIDPSTLEILKEQEAKFVLGGAKVDHLTLEGIDLVVDLRDLPEQQSTLFLCRGAEVILRDCTITLVNVGDRRVSRFSVFRVEEGGRPNRIVLERSTIRGPIRTLVDLAAARAEVVLDRSLVIGEAGPLFNLEPVDRPTRELYFHRSFLATRGPVVEFSCRSTPLSIRALGSTFAQIDGGRSPGMLNAKSGFAGEAKSAIDWAGEDNTFVGWSAWLTSGPEATVRVTGLGGVRTAWPGSDANSTRAANPWPATIARDDLNPADVAQLAPDRRATLAMIAKAHPSLRGMTYDSIVRLPALDFSDSLIPPYIAPAVVAPPPPVQKAVANPTGPTPRVAAPAAKPPGPLEQTFDLAAPPWSGDLGLFLAEKLVPGTTRATIRVRGGGIHPCSPIRLPYGLSIAILGESAEGTSLPMPTFVPKLGAIGRSMIELHGGDLALANLGFAADGPVRPNDWVRVEDGHLGIRHCRFRDPGVPSPGAGPVISFLATGARLVPPRVGPFRADSSRPTARIKDTAIWTGGDAVAAELCRGVVAFDNCLVISGGTAIKLAPRNPGNELFEADLVLERCTIADDRNGIHLGPWPGDPTGPGRPLLVTTRSCVFPRTQVGGSGSLLLADPDALARGALFWQSSLDAFEVGRFVAATGSQPSSVPPADIKKGWIDLWGSQHARGVRGPDPRRNESVLRYKERPRPNRVTPASLELDPKFHKDLGVNFKELPTFPKG